MTTYYRATFSDGTVIKRSTASRKYTHAWLVRRQWDNAERPEWAISEAKGFCGSIVLAYNTMGRYQAPERGKMLLAEVAPVFEITAQEYRSKPR
jgi:hypothetical protein